MNKFLLNAKNLSILITLFPLLANAAGVPTSFTYQGKALNAAGTAPLTSTVSFTLSITDPSSACILYQETQTNVNLATTNGIFALQVGSAVGATKRVSGTDPGLTMTTVFANAGTQLVGTNGSCPGYTPSTNDVRKLHVVITPSSGSAITVSPDLTINAVPNAMVAETVQGFSVSTLTQLITPPGFLMPYTGVTCPTGFILADGSSYSVTTYPNLAAAYVSSGLYIWGGTVTSGSFNVPNSKGVFLRGAGSQTISGIGYTGTLATIQADQMQGHIHNGPNLIGTGGASAVAGFTLGSSNFLYNNNTGSPITDGTNGTPRTGSETRPVNISVNYCIKY
jgi:hypothetical protein